MGFPTSAGLLKYSAKKEKPTVEIGTCWLNDEEVFYVKDNGAGFDMQYAIAGITPYDPATGLFGGTMALKCEFAYPSSDVKLI